MTAPALKLSEEARQEMIAKGANPEHIKAFEWEGFPALLADQTVLICGGEGTRGIETKCQKLHLQNFVNFKKDGEDGTVPRKTGIILQLNTFPYKTFCKVKTAAPKGVFIRQHRMTNGEIESALIYLNHLREKPPAKDSLSDNGAKPVLVQTAVTTPEAMSPAVTIETASVPASTDSEPVIAPVPSLSSLCERLDGHLRDAASLQDTILEVMETAERVEQQASDLEKTITEQRAEISRLAQQNSVLIQTCSTLEYEKNSLAQEKSTTAANLATERAKSKQLQDQCESIRIERDKAINTLNDIKKRLGL